MPAIDTSLGAALPTFVRQSNLETWNRYAAVNHEFVPIHMDDEAGRKAGFPGAIGMGNLLWAYYHNLIRQWIGGSGRIDEVSARFQEPNLRDSTISVQGRVTAVEQTVEGTRVTVELWAEDERQRRLSSGNATVTLFA